MKFLEWKNKHIGDFDIFAIACDAEKDIIVNYYGTNEAEGVTFRKTNKYFYFINLSRKVITPMPKLSLAFSGLYNGYPPYGDEIHNFEFDIKEYKLETYEEF